MSPLANTRHEKFAQLVATGFPANRAYMGAGYHKGRLSSVDPAASRLLRNHKVSARIAELKAVASEKAAAALEVSTGRVLQELAAIGFANIADYLSFDEDGKPALSLSELDRQKGAGIAEIITQRTKDGTVLVRVKLGNKQGALTKLLDYCMAVDELARQNKPNASAAQKPAPQRPFDIEEMRRRYGLAGKKEEVN